jgi:hypothetical protein
LPDPAPVKAFDRVVAQAQKRLGQLRLAHRAGVAGGARGVEELGGQVGVVAKLSAGDCDLTRQQAVDRYALAGEGSGWSGQCRKRHRAEAPAGLLQAGQFSRHGDGQRPESGKCLLDLAAAQVKARPRP